MFCSTPPLRSPSPGINRRSTVTGRLSSINYHGFQTYLTLGHSRARYFPPEVGGLIFQGTASVPGVFRIDHDQACQQTANFRYQHGKDGIWADFIWRFDSGLVVTGLPTAQSALLLTPNQQVDLGLTCNGVEATVADPLRSLQRNHRLHPADPAARIRRQQRSQSGPCQAPRHFRSRRRHRQSVSYRDRQKGSVALHAEQRHQQGGLYNFLSTFSGTHFIPPRTSQVSVTYSF
jgi:hypothetical protein